MKWTALDLKNLAALFDHTADAVLNFRIQNRNTLTPLQKERLTRGVRTIGFLWRAT